LPCAAALITAAITNVKTYANLIENRDKQIIRSQPSLVSEVLASSHDWKSFQKHP
jgi:hypothetical protein